MSIEKKGYKKEKKVQRIPSMFILILMILISFDVSPSQGQIINGDFGDGLNGWYTEGDVKVEDGMAIMRTGDADWITLLYTDFTVSGDRLTFRYSFDTIWPDDIEYPEFPSYPLDSFQLTLDAGGENYFDIPLAWEPTGGLIPFSVDISSIAPGTRAALSFMLFDEDDEYRSIAIIDDISDPAEALPEPGTLILLGSGLIGLFMYGRYKSLSPGPMLHTPQVKRPATTQMARLFLSISIIFMILMCHNGVAYAERIEGNVDDRTSLEFTSPLFNTRTNILTLNMTVANISDTSLFTPMKVVITGISAPDVAVANPDGYTPEGLPFFDMALYVDDGELSPGESTSPRKISFYNPGRVKFRWDQDVLAVIEEYAEKGPVIFYICLVPGESQPVCKFYAEDFEIEDSEFDRILQSPLPEMYLYEQVRVDAFDMEDLPLEVTINGEEAIYNEEGFYYYRNLILKDGLNTISIRATNSAGLSTGREILLNIDSIPPVIKVTEPAEGALVTMSDLVLSGTVDDTEINTVILIKDFITRKEVPVLGGIFRDQILLSPGHNNITIKATDRAGNMASYHLDVPYAYSELGAIAGRISDSLLGLPLAGAMVTATSSSGYDRTTVSIADGGYRFEGIRSGDVILHIEKEGYMPLTLQIFSPGGDTPCIQNVGLLPVSAPGTFTLTGQARNTAGVPLSNIRVSVKDTPLFAITDLNGIYVIAGIPRTSFVAETFHEQYERESLNVNAGMYGPETAILTHHFILREIPFTIGILSPEEGEYLTEDSLVVTGFVKGGGRDVGVRVNDVLAQVYNGYFVANDVPMAEGVNRITAEMLDPSGTLLTDSREVTLSRKDGTGVVIHSLEAGIVPLEISVEVEGPEGVSFTGYNLEISGPGAAEVISEGISEGVIRYRVFVSEAGVYILSFHAVDSDGNTYQDTFGFTGMAREDVEGTLRMLWTRFKEDLTVNHVADALSLVSPETSWRYSEQFSLLGDRLPGAFAEIGDIQVVSLKDNVAKARVSLGEVTHYVWFVRDIYGLWKIHKF